MSHASKPTVANYREFNEAYSTHLVVVGKRNPFAAQETELESTKTKEPDAS